MTSRRSPQPDAVWQGLVALVMDARENLRRKVSVATDLPFGRVRALRRLAAGPRTLAELAEAIGSDAPATTVLVNDLERRELVVREPHPTNRRAKLVSLTAAGRAVVARANREIDRAPPAFAALSEPDLVYLARIVDTLTGARDRERQ